jgi:hypothetical protein
MYRRPGIWVHLIALAVALIGAAAPSHAGQAQAAPSASPSLPTLDGPPAPEPPAVLSRNASGKATLRAVRLTTPLKIDGRLDDAIYTTVPGAGDFVQQLPRENTPATEKTLVWVFFDDKNLYISARCFDTHPELEIATEMRRDDNNLVSNESLSFVLDTFYDRRNGFFFQTGPLGTIRDQAVQDDQTNQSWNTVWEVRSARDDEGWTTELQIPFKSLRYAGSGPQVWGFNVRRVVKWKNENDYFSAAPASFGIGAINRMQTGGNLVGVETPLQSLNLEFKPYVVSTVTTDRAAAVPYANDLSKNIGVDFKYGLTRGLVFDATVNTDFAQVEEDTQQVNLTRFSLFFPEKRDFFLEGEGIFAFGGGAIGERSGNGTIPDVPILFFSRRIGLNNGLTVPVRTGARVTGRAGAYTLGIVNIETGDKPAAAADATNFSVVRVKRNILRRSSIGIMGTGRTITPLGNGTTGSNITGGFDAIFNFYRNVGFVGYWAKSSTPGLQGRDTSYRGRFDYTGDNFGLQLEHIAVEDQFRPEVGYVRRPDFRRSYGDVRVSRRTRRSRVFRRVNLDTAFDYVQNAAHTQVQNKESKTTFNLEMNSSDVLRVAYRRDYELLPRNFAIASGVTVPRGGYTYRAMDASYSFGQQRRLAGAVSTTIGSLYNGTIRSIGISNGYATFNRHLNFEPGMTLNWVDLPWGSFLNRLVTNRTIVTPTPRMLLSSLMQWNGAAHTLSTSVRLNWEYRPSSQLFVVYSDGRTTVGQGWPDMVNRSFAVKVTRLLRF